MPIDNALQIAGDVEELLINLNEGTSDLCCFENTHEIVTKSVLFESNEDPAAVASRLFVRLYNYYVYM